MKHSKPKKKPRARRTGPLTKAERQITKMLVKDSPQTITPNQTTALARMFKRPVSTVKSMLTRAREDLASDASFYVDAHRQVVEDALAINGPQALDIARKAAAFAITNISGEGKRLIDKQESGPQGTRIFIGVKLSNMAVQPETTIDMSSDAVEGEVL